MSDTRPHTCADPDRDELFKRDADDDWASHEDEDLSGHLKAFQSSPPAPNGAIDGGEQDEQPARSTPQAGSASSAIDMVEEILDDWFRANRVRLISRILDRYAPDLGRNDSLELDARRLAHRIVKEWNL
jgi:hypothetical protein